MHRSRLGVTIALGLWVVGAAAPAGAERAAWNQERVTKLAQELVVKAEAVQAAIRQGPQSSIGSGQGSSFYRLKQDVRRARSEAKQLAAMLEGGSGFDETLPVYQDLRTMARNAAENARRTFMPEPTLEAISDVGDVINRIAPYYETPPAAE